MTKPRTCPAQYTFSSDNLKKTLRSIKLPPGHRLVLRSVARGHTREPVIDLEYNKICILTIETHPSDLIALGMEIQTIKNKIAWEEVKAIMLAAAEKLREP